jgi:hypothetical protein
MNKRFHWYSSSKVRIPLLVIGAILTVICSQVVIPNGFQERDEAIKAINGELIPFDVDMSKPFNLYLSGGFPIPLSKDELADGFSLSKFLYVANFTDDLFNIRFSANKMFVSAVLRNSDNVIIAEIENNEWKTRNPDTLLFWDRNYNAYAFGIIGSNNIPTLQVVLRGSNDIQIGGLFYTKTGRIDIAPMASGDAEIFLNPTDQQLIDANIPTIFRYPALTEPSNLGKIINPIYPSSDPLSEANWIIGIGIVLTVLGTIFMAFFGAETILIFVKQRAIRDDAKKTSHVNQKRGSPQTSYYQRMKRKAKEKKRRSSKRK